MTFVLLDSWQIHVMEADQTTSLTTFIFRDPDLIRKLARVGGALDTPEKQAFLERGIERGGGDLYLMLQDQHSRRRRSVKRSSMPPQATPTGRWRRAAGRAANDDLGRM
jgi:hypothetical protein